MHSRRSSWVGGGLALLLAVAQLRLIVLLFRNDYGHSIQAARGIARGRPHWQVYQNRVLGPYAAEGLSALFPNYIVAHVVLSIAVLTAAGFLAWRMGGRMGGRSGASLALVALHLAFALLLSNPADTLPWIYIWDFIDVLLFLLFVEFVASERPWPWFAVLAIVGVLNHEIAVFVAGWLIVDPLARWALGRRGVTPPVPLDHRRMLAGVVTATASLLLVQLLRAALLVDEVGPELFGRIPRSSSGSFHFTLVDNLDMLHALATQLVYGTPQLVPLYLLGTAALLIAVARRDPPRFLGLCVTHLTMIAALLTFGLLLETRIYVVLIPAVVLGAVLLTAGPAPPASS